MLKVSTSEHAETVTMRLEGKLIGAWVKEVERVWNSLAESRRGRNLLVDMCGVTFVDAAGKDLLTRMYKAGASLDAAGPLVKYILQSIKAGRNGH